MRQPIACYAREEKDIQALYCILATALDANSTEELKQNLQAVRAIAEQTLDETKRG